MATYHDLLPTDVTDDAHAVENAHALATLLSALADPTRLAILAHLRGGEHQVGELATHLGLAQSTVSQHLNVLRDTGLISTHTHGRARVSRLEHSDELTALLVTAETLRHRSLPQHHQQDGGKEAKL
ncbi:ArsR/SmtB family transcription factor [Actinomyces trachealis]|uniref:ArsR/SmtB family transcription factor n=1 Tax=Actinomyces trachealis TaxID=2763540 RepID=UPI001892CF8E|nr:metalloregulator ArsR/SmtB family transcription factor [Actinomyces trachealis]